MVGNTPKLKQVSESRKYNLFQEDQWKISEYLYIINDVSNYSKSRVKIFVINTKRYVKQKMYERTPDIINIS